MKNSIESAARFIRRADYVLANDVLRDEYGVEYGNPAQIGYCSFDPEDIIGKALERTANVFGCLTHTENNLAPVGLLAVTNNLFLKEYSYDQAFYKGHKE